MKTIKTLKKLLQKSSCRTASLYTSCACYYIILSILPAFLFLLSLLSFLPLSQEAVWRFLQTVIPEPLVKPITDLIRMVQRETTVPLFSVSALIWVWSASKGIFFIADGMDAVLRIPIGQSFVRKRVSAMLRFLMLSLSLVLTALLYLFGERLLAVSADLLPGLSDFLLTVVHHRVISSFVLLSVIFSLVYRLHPGAELKYPYCLSGGAATAAGWLLFTWMFSIYVNHFSSQYRLFGEIGTLLLLSVWLRYCILILLYGIKYAALRSKGHKSMLRYIQLLFRNIHE